MSRSGAGGTVITSSLLEYLKPEINRPDIFEERTLVKGGIVKKGSSSKTNIAVTLLTITLSAFIFVTIVGFASILQAYFDVIVVDDQIWPVVVSRFYYSIVFLFITIILTILFLYAYDGLKLGSS